MIKRGHIRQFLAVVDAGSFTQAAARLRLTQPTLSAGIAELERLTGTRLLVRDRREVRLTEAGGRFLPIARGLERDFRMLDQFGAAAERDWPDLKLGIMRTLAAPMFVALVGALSADYRLEVIDGRDAELRSALSSGRIHCALTLLRADESGPQVRELLCEPYCMMVHAGHRLAGAGPVPAGEFARETMIARRSCEMLGVTSRFFTGQGVRPRFAYRSEDDARCLAMVAAGQGMTTAPLSMAIAGTIPITIEGYDFSRRVGLACDAGWLAAPGHAALFDHVAKAAASAWNAPAQT